MAKTRSDIATRNVLIKVRFGRGNEDTPNWGPWEKREVIVTWIDDEINKISLKDYLWVDYFPRHRTVNHFEHLGYHMEVENSIFLGF